MERWLRIPGWEDYEVSSCGRFRRYDTQDPVCPSLNSYAKAAQYWRITLYRQNGMGSEQKSFYAHRLVARLFVAGKSAESWQVDHVDGDKNNNRAENLEWVTPSENVRRAWVRRRAKIRRRFVKGVEGCPF